MSAATAFFRELAASRIGALVDIGGVLALKAGAVVLALTLFTLAAWVLGAHDFGTFSMLFSAAGLVSVFATSGQQVLLMRSWNEYAAQQDLPHLKGALMFAAAGYAGAALIASVLFYAVLSAIVPAVLAVAVTLYMALFGLQLVTMHLVRTAIGIGIGDGIGSTLTLAPPIAYLLYCHFTGSGGDLATLFLLFSAGTGAAVAIHLGAVALKIRRLFPGLAGTAPRFERTVWPMRSLKLWISNGLEASNQYVDVLIVGLLMTPSVAGAYFIITRLANMFAVAADGMYMFSSRHIPALYYRAEFERLELLLDSIAKATFALIAAGIVVVVFGGHWMLLIFSEAYVSYHAVLVLLCIGTAAVAAAGPSAPVLMLTGHESRSLMITVATLTMRVIGFFVLIPYFQVTGAVAATAFSFVFMAIALRHSAKRLTGIDGSIARLVLGRGSRQATPERAGRGSGERA